MDNIHTLIIPDIHGRKFWKETLLKYNKQEYPKLVIIFLGDYVDPYQFEGVTREDAISNFQEIINIAKDDNRIHLLIGNHDMHYWYDAEFKSRVDFKNYDTIKNMFLQNFTMFDVAYEEIINGEKFLYTHAGVSKPWLDHLHFIGKTTLDNIKNKKANEDRKSFAKMLSKMKPTAKELNQMKLDWQGQANLWMASYARGGEHNVGSCIWEDLSEWGFNGMEIPGIWQIFGHSRWSKPNPDDAYINEERKFACVDTASSWIITNKGKIEKA